MKKQGEFRIFRFFLTCSIAAILLAFPFSEWAIAEKTLQTGAFYADKAELEALQQDLAKIDQFATAANHQNASAIVGQNIQARSLYLAYLQRAESLSQELLSLQKKLDAQNNTLSLQQLGALAQRLSAENQQFRSSFTHGENQFQSYHLIETAITNLEDAIRYWRLSNRYRPLYRGSVQAKKDDDEILKLKLQTAVNAIEALRVIIETREALTKDLQDDH